MPFPEVDHDLLESSLVHLSVGDRDTGFRYELAQAGCRAFDRLDSVVHPEHLALAEQFASDRLHRDSLVVLADEGQDRLSVRRWGLQQRQISDTDERHFEGAGDRGSRHGDHVDRGR